MGVALEQSPFISVQDYLEGEKISENRHEYVDGLVEAMSGARKRHNLINSNIVGLLHTHLRGNPCSVYASGFKVRIKSDESERFYYPDALVDCVKDASGDTYWTESPIIVIEILSPSTMRKDLNEKLEAYKTIPSVKEILIISQSEPLVFVHTRKENWKQICYRVREQRIKLESIEYELILEQIYQGIDYPEEGYRWFEHETI